MSPGVSSIISSIIAGTPRTDGAEGNRGQRATDKTAERQGRGAAPRIDFATAAHDAAANQNQPGGAAEALREARAEASSGFPKLRRVTDSGKAAGEAIDIPSHLERRRAWREAKGLNTFHAQHLAQADETAPDTETRNAATQAYRSQGGRGKLDIDLAQRFSLTV